MNRTSTPASGRRTPEGEIPLLTGRFLEDARRAVLDTAEQIGTATGGDGFTLASGGTGIAVALAQVGQALGRPDLRSAARAVFEEALERLGEHPRHPGLYGGFCGPAWAAARYGAMILGEEPDPEFFEDTDLVLEEFLRTCGPKADYDLINGLVGVGIYALEHADSPAGGRLLASCRDRLVAMAEPRGEHVSWFTIPEILPPLQRQEAPEGYFNLGVAHGIPGLLAFLALAQGRCGPGDDGGRALEGGVAWLLERRHPRPDGFSFASWVTHENADPGGGARLAWCYGDLGIAAALAVAAEASGREDWDRAARDLALGVSRIPARASGVRDAGLCHGAAGVAHLLHRLGYRWRDETLLDAARHWFGLTLAMRDPAAGAGGFPARHWRERPGNPDGPGFVVERDDGFLTGAGGVALALLAAISPEPSCWDRVLLVS